MIGANIKNYSLRTQLTLAARASEIRLLKQRYRDVCFILVEGETDRRLFEGLFRKDKCRVMGENGKSNVIEILRQLKRYSVNGVIGIVDDDFDSLNGISHDLENLFYTDTHDIETLIMCSPAFEKVINEFGDMNKIHIAERKKQMEIRDIILMLCLPIGYLRWISQKRLWKLNFRDLPIDEVIDEEKLLLKEDLLIKKVLEKSGKIDVDEQEINRELESIKKGKHNPWLVCQGHDLIDILSFLFIKKQFKHHWKDRANNIKGVLRVSYHISYFKNTKLFSRLIEWEKRNNGFILFEQFKEAV